jgi:membrane-associated phospholipid phosphatase
MYWEYGAGGRRAYWLWNELASRYMLESRWDDNAPLAARAYALTNIASHDASVACWDGKYMYWALRPSQLDAEFSPLFPTPNHPSYPSAHSCISTATANVLATLFPNNANEVLGLSEQASESRVYAGIHFRSDVDAGIELGANVGNAVLEHALSGSNE